MNNRVSIKILVPSILLVLGNFLPLAVQAQSSAFIRLIQPFKENQKTATAKQFIIGSTCVGCSLTVNDSNVFVYPTGAFVQEIELGPEADSVFQLVAKPISGKAVKKKISFQYRPYPAPAAVSSFDIETIAHWPEGNLILQVGDKIRFTAKALPGCTVKLFDQFELSETPVTESLQMPGVYSGEYEISSTDSFRFEKIFLSIIDSSGNKKTKYTGTTLSTLEVLPAKQARTIGRLAHLEYGLGEDRLGGAKIGYIDSNIILRINGKVGTKVRVQLAGSRTAYIPEEHIEYLSESIKASISLTGKMLGYGDEKYDYVKIWLNAKLPYQSYQALDPSRIVVDIFGATNNTNWITQMQSMQAIRHIHYEQIADEIFRVTIQLQQTQHWGHTIYYNGNSLMIRINRPPVNASLKNMIIAIDAGHGGTNNGAVGATGVYEKDLTLALSLQLKETLEKEGAVVIMTREQEEFFDNKERILFYRDSTPQLLLSIHLNSSEDPLRVKGTSAYYRHLGFKSLSSAIYKRMLELGLSEYGLTGSFNFMLNSPTEYPNCLIETLFISNPEEEMNMLNPDYRQRMADKIVLGVKDFLKQSH
jgi:N-acetylmuramoyl-L-alanine amidase